METDNKERRKHERIHFRKEVLIDGIATSSTIDISKSGLYVCTSQPFENYSLIDVELPLKGDILRLKAEVRYCQPGIGIGVRFIDLNDEQREKIKELIYDVKTQSASPKEG